MVIFSSNTKQKAAAKSKIQPLILIALSAFLILYFSHFCTVELRKEIVASATSFTRLAMKCVAAKMRMRPIYQMEKEWKQENVVQQRKYQSYQQQQPNLPSRDD